MSILQPLHFWKANWSTGTPQLSRAASALQEADLLHLSGSKPCHCHAAGREMESQRAVAAPSTKTWRPSSCPTCRAPDEHASSDFKAPARSRKLPSLSRTLRKSSQTPQSQSPSSTSQAAWSNKSLWSCSCPAHAHQSRAGSEPASTSGSWFLPPCRRPGVLKVTPNGSTTQGNRLSQQHAWPASLAGDT